VWLLSTVLEQIKGHPSCDILEPEPETESAIPKTLCLEIQELSTFDCVIVGAGMAGLSVAGRLKALGVSYIILEQNDHIGDNWINRYDSARRE
jgi:phosphoglycerate dehydrogenase-like enzyme